MFSRHSPHVLLPRVAGGVMKPAGECPFTSPYVYKRTRGREAKTAEIRETLLAEPSSELLYMYAYY